MLLTNLLLCSGLAAASTLHGRSDNDAINGVTYTSRPNTGVSQQPNFTFDELYDLQKQFLDHFIFPVNVEEAKSINSTLLSEDCLGRVDITRTFKGRELNTEYLFGLFANLAASPTSLSLLGVPFRYEILHFAANQNIASASTRFMFNFTALNLVLPLRIDTWNTFNSDKQISQYDATFVWWDWAVATLLEAAKPKLGANTTASVVQKITGGLSQSICSTAMTHCTGKNKQYNSMGECMVHLTKKTRFGASYELGRDTLLCRMVHQNMVPFRPSVHCSHIGKSGGGYCTDNTNYTGTVNQDFYTNSPFLPHGTGDTGESASERLDVLGTAQRVDDA